MSDWIINQIEARGKTRLMHFPSSAAHPRPSSFWVGVHRIATSTFSLSRFFYDGCSRQSGGGNSICVDDGGWKGQNCCNILGWWGFERTNSFSWWNCDICLTFETRLEKCDNEILIHLFKMWHFMQNIVWIQLFFKKSLFILFFLVHQLDLIAHLRNPEPRIWKVS